MSLPVHEDPAHDPNHIDHHPETVGRNARVGMVLFILYVLFYLGFMVLNAFYPEKMHKPAAMGVNLAIVYGMGLIFLAFVLSILYMVLCRSKAK